MERGGQNIPPKLRQSYDTNRVIVVPTASQRSERGQISDQGDSVDLASMSVGETHATDAQPLKCGD
jgi:hypothetical protein